MKKFFTLTIFGFAIGTSILLYAQSAEEEVRQSQISLMSDIEIDSKLPDRKKLQLIAKDVNTIVVWLETQDAIPQANRDALSAAVQGKALWAWVTAVRAEEQRCLTNASLTADDLSFPAFPE